MPFTVEWYDKNETILLERMTGNWGYEDYRQMVDQAAAMINTKFHAVHVISDFVESPAVSREAFSGASYAELKMPPNQGVVVYINPEPVLELAIGIARRAGFRATKHLYTAATIEEAMQMIEERKASV